MDGEFLGNHPCEDCGSNDNLSVYRKLNDDGEEYLDGFCWSCDEYKSPRKLNEWGFEAGSIKYSGGEEVSVDDIQEILDYDIRGIKERRIKKSVAEVFGLRVGYDTESGEIYEHYYPVTKDGKVTGFFKRTLPKSFSAVGDVKKPQLQGQHLFDKGGEFENKINRKFIILTEGFLDMCAAFQMMQDKNPNYITPVVSLPNGINAKSVKDNYHFLNSFEKVIVCVDTDEVGRKGAKEICKSLPMGKTKIMSFNEKDPCDMLKRGKQDEFYKAFWGAEEYSPAGIVSGEGLWGVVSTDDNTESVPYPWEGLTKITHGIRAGEMVTLTAGSGVAKSTFARKIAHHLLKVTDANIGMMFLEESVKRTGLSLMSMEANKLLHIPDTPRTEEELRHAFDSTLGTGRVFLYNHFGSADIDTIIENITYFVRAANCKYIFLDHISIMVSAGGHGDERKALDEICTKLRTLVQELDISLFIVSHLKRPSGDTGHEQGLETSLSQLRGSAGIAQLSDMVIGFERNGQHEDPIIKNTTTVRVLKNRFVGVVGIATKVLYNSVTGELVEVKDINDDDDISDFLNADMEDEEDLRLIA